MLDPKTIDGLMEQMLFSDRPEYWLLKDAANRAEKIAPSGRLDVQLPNGSRVHFMWGGYKEPTTPETEGG